MLLGTVLRIFYYLYDNYRIIDLPPTCVSTWIFSLLLVEFVYYWVHRALHEINIFWASHQFHHNAVELDVSTTLRDTVVDLIIYEVSFEKHFYKLKLKEIFPSIISILTNPFKSKSLKVWIFNLCITWIKKAPLL